MRMPEVITSGDQATELAAEHPGHVAAAWLGHSTEVAQRHYWQVTDADFDRAIRTPDATPESAAEKAAQQAHVLMRSESQAARAAHEKTPVLPGFAAPRETVQMCTVAEAGVELSQKVRRISTIRSIHLHQPT